MGLLDRFKKNREKIGRDKKPTHVVTDRVKAQTAEEKKKKEFAAVPAGGPVIKKPATTGEKSAAKAPPRKRQTDTGPAYRTLLRAVISEKSTSLSANRQYVFTVAPQANKITIRRAVESLYGIRPQKINVINIPGKTMRYGRTEGRTKNWKKAIVTLQPGQKLDITGN